MGSISKHQKSVDRLSNLPGSLIAHILSFLPTKDVLRSSILSTFWNQQWVSITNLDFDNTSPSTNSTQSTRASFVNVVYRVLLFTKVTRLDVFQLKCSLVYCDQHIRTWVSSALSQDVRKLYLLFLPSKRVCPLPRCLFTSKTLGSIELGTDIVIEVPESISFECLKILLLKSVSFLDGESLSRLVSNCNVLNELSLHGNIGDMEVINISSLVLKILILTSGTNYESNSYTIVLNTPKLQYLGVSHDRIHSGYSMHKLPCLHSACVSVPLNDTPNIPLAMEDLAVGISNAKFVSLSKHAFHALNDRKLRKYPCLTDLKIYGTSAEIQRSSLIAFLENAPQLATLTFNHGLVGSDYREDDFDQEPIRYLRHSMLFNLKIVEIRSFKGLDVELEIVRYLLKKSKCLKKLIISYCPLIKEKEAEVSKKLLILPRASDSCEIVLT